MEEEDIIEDYFSADTGKLGENRNLRCKMCESNFMDPKLLPCGHTFCKRCVIDHLQHNTETESSGFLCPSCSEFVPITSNAEEDAGNWSDFLEDNLIVAGMIDIISSSDFEDVNPIEGSGMVQWPVDTESEVPKEWFETAKIIPECKLHHKNLEYYCKTHAKILCVDCVILCHKSCEDVVKSADVTAVHFEKAEKVSKLAMANVKLAKVLMVNLTDKSVELMINRDDVKSELRKAKEEMIKNLNAAEAELCKELDEAYSHRSSLYEERLKCCKSIIKEATKTRNCMDVLKKVQCPEFIVNSSIESQVLCESELALLDEIRSTTLESKILFTQSSTLGPFLRDYKHFGQLTVSDSVMTSSCMMEPHLATQQSFSLEEIPSMLKATQCLNARLADDSYNCWITGVTFLKNDNIVLVDRNNEKVKLFSRENNHLHSIKLSASKTTLFAITSSKDHEVAVTLPIQHTVQFLSTLEDTLIPTRKIDTKQQCYGIASGLKQIFVCCAQLRNSPCCIKVYDYHDELVRDIIFDNEGKPLFTMLSSANIAFDLINNRLAVVDQPMYRHSVVTFNMDGSKKSRDYMPYLSDNACGIVYLKSQLCIALGNRGFGKISETEDGERTVTEMGVDYKFNSPYAMSVNYTNDKIAISQANPTFNFSSNNDVIIAAAISDTYLFEKQE
ncbi:hypothetical protein FSP39_004710 [Pinctada imbricata]|uniref:RING-type domain-containing protein n=1 Tax=Pinctada imbricata TaxID=66713 RepID=A0AA89BQB8_PINIB|nr:hypothetical protein FSP39_004710 [Pinctada imbricata]